MTKTKESRKYFDTYFTFQNMTASEALQEQQCQLPYPTAMPLEANCCCKCSAEKDHESCFFLVHMASKGSITHWSLNSNGVSILIIRDNYLLCFLM